jgi:hypothetical protein
MEKLKSVREGGYFQDPRREATPIEDFKSGPGPQFK